MKEILTARKILEALTSPENEWEKAIILRRILHELQKPQSREIEQSHLVFLKRNVPNVIYVGLAYRLVRLNNEESVYSGIYKNVEDANAAGHINIGRLIDTITNFAPQRFQSWARTMDGIVSEFRSHLEGSRHPNLYHWYLFKAHIVGYSLEEASRCLYDLQRKLIGNRNFPPQEFIEGDSLSEFVFDCRNIYKDFTRVEEIVAPMPSDLNFLRVYK